jgi:hypothetical protein
MQHHIGTPLPPLRERRPEVPKEVAAMAEKLLAKRPEDRYQTGQELAKDIAEYRRKLREQNKEGASGPGLFTKLLGDGTWFRKKMG